MNRRQAKKAFKKKYGVNPNKLAKEYARINWDTIREQLQASIQYMVETLNTFCGRLNAYISEVAVFIKEHPDYAIRLSLASTEEERAQIAKEIQELQSNYDGRHNV